MIPGGLMEILKVVGGTGAFLTILYFLLQTLIKHVLSKELVEHEAKVRLETQLEINKVTAQLTQVQNDLHIRLSALHPKRLEVIEDLYRLLVKAEMAMQDLTSSFRRVGSPSDEELWKTAANALDALMLFFVDHRIYFDVATAQKIEACHRAMFDPAITYSVYLPLPVVEPSAIRERAEVLKGAAKSFNEIVPAARAAVEKSFRELLGVHQPESRID